MPTKDATIIRFKTLFMYNLQDLMMRLGNEGAGSLFPRGFPA